MGEIEEGEERGRKKPVGLRFYGLVSSFFLPIQDGNVLGWVPILLMN